MTISVSLPVSRCIWFKRRAVGKSRGQLLEIQSERECLEDQEFRRAHSPVNKYVYKALLCESFEKASRPAVAVALVHQK